MKIKKIALENIGPYVGNNLFLFDVDNKTKRVVLIGGKNGAGKTTLFNAIKTCLYGCTAYGFESTSARYYSEVSKLLNEQEKAKKVGIAQIVVDLLFDDGKENHVYTFDRSWHIRDKHISEKFDLYKDDAILSQTEKSNFETFLLRILPPNLLRFYFFDGERISDFAFNNKNSDFKEAFLKLCHLDTMEIIQDNFRRISRGKTLNGDNIAHEYEHCLEADNLLADRVSAAEDDYQVIAKKIAETDDQLAYLEKEYAKSGGISQKEWRGMQEQIAKEELRRENQRKWLKEVANNVLPFVILRHQLEELRDRIALEHKAQVNANVRSMIETPEIKSVISKILSTSGVELADDIAKKIIYEISGYSDATSKTVQILNLSDFDRYELTAKINNLLAFDINRIKNATNDIDASLNHVKRIREKMERSSIENYDSYLEKKSDLNAKRSALTQRLFDLDRELQDRRAQKTVSAAKLSKAKSNYGAFLKKQSINDISARALLAFDELQSILHQRSIHLVEEEFKKDFTALINKSDLIDGIYIDANLNVIPYKNEKFDASNLKGKVARRGEEYLITQVGLHAYNVYAEIKNVAGEEIELPVEVKKQLSAGEKQIFFMALYQALSKLNKIDVPYIVDTPFARIDKEHRGKILNQFFKRLNGQVIILSTDEEIVDEYYAAIADAVSNTFVLQHTESGNTEILPDTYFGRIL